MSKRLTNLVCGGIFLVGSVLGGCTGAVKALSVNSSGEGLVEVKGKLRIRYNEDGIIFFEDLGPNARLIIGENGTYGVADEDSLGMRYYEFKDGEFTQTYHPKDKDQEF